MTDATQLMLWIVVVIGFARSILIEVILDERLKLIENRIAALSSQQSRNARR